MKLDNIGFYTLSDQRCKNACSTSPLMRAEILLTDKCNFRCTYCRHLPPKAQGTMDLSYAKNLITTLSQHNLVNIRFSGGEPTLHPNIVEIVEHAKSSNVKRIAISTNGSALLDIYDQLLVAGVNDFSISLDACCSISADKMSGTTGKYDHILKTIEYLSSKTYVTVGIVLNESNYPELEEIISLAVKLNVADIRVIPAAQYASKLSTINFDAKQFPILQYRKNNATQNIPVRGINEPDSHMCPLVLDDLVIAGKYHYPCIIYLREQGEPIGIFNPNTFRQERESWFNNHDTHTDDICKHNCLDVCRDYNNQWLHLKNFNAPKLNPDNFDWLSWRLGEEPLDILGEHLRFNTIKYNPILRSKIKTMTIGYCPSTECTCRPKDKHSCVMFNTNNKLGWIHIRNDEMYLIFKTNQV